MRYLMCLVYFPGAAAAAVMSSSKVTTVLRPASQLPNAATAQPAVQHIIHQPIQAGSSQAALQNPLLRVPPGPSLQSVTCNCMFIVSSSLLIQFVGHPFLIASCEMVPLALC